MQNLQQSEQTAVLAHPSVETFNDDAQSRQLIPCKEGQEVYDVSSRLCLGKQRYLPEFYHHCLQAALVILGGGTTWQTYCDVSSPNLQAQYGSHCILTSLKIESCSTVVLVSEYSGRSHTLPDIRKMQAIRDTFSEAIKSLRWSSKDIHDLSGLTVLVTGATDGVGLECARELAAHHAHVIVHCWNKEKGDEYVSHPKSRPFMMQARSFFSNIAFVLQDCGRYQEDSGQQLQGGTAPLRSDGPRVSASLCLSP